MKESLERQDSAAVFELLGEHDRARRQAAEHRARFDAAFGKRRRQHHRVGRAGRDRRDQARPRRLLPPVRRLSRAPRRPHGAYFRVLEPRFNAVRADCDRLLRLNQEAMRRKAAAASAIARRWFFFTLGLAGADDRRRRGRAQSVACHPRPRSSVDRRHDKVAAGDLDASVPVRSADEIGPLADGFNRMAARIRELRRSDLGSCSSRSRRRRRRSIPWTTRSS